MQEDNQPRICETRNAGRPERSREGRKLAARAPARVGSLALTSAGSMAFGTCSRVRRAAGAGKARSDNSRVQVGAEPTIVAVTGASVGESTLRWGQRLQPTGLARLHSDCRFSRC